MQNIRKLLKKCESFDIVSFDIFDTLLKRDVMEPIDVFSIIEKKYDSLLQNRKSEYSKKRLLAEKKARESSQYDEITLEEIYDVIDFSDEEKTILKQMELEIEADILHGNKSIISFYKQCIKLGKSVYIVSDMYLPQDFLEKILIREGITGYKKVFISCVYRKTKRSGLLFKVLCEEERISPKDIVHIGDSRYADYIGPRKIGIQGIHINRVECNTLYMETPTGGSSLSARCLYSFVNSRISCYESRGMRLGYEVLGPIIYAYCCWIHGVVIQSQYNYKIWFAARDMYLFKNAYERIYGDLNNGEYVYISRKSLRPMYAEAVHNITRSGDVFARGKYSLKEIVEYFGYSMDEAIIGKDIDIDLKKYDIRKLDQYPEVVKALSSVSIKKKEEELSELGNQYLKEHGLFDRNIILADVGWHGTTQLILQEIQKEKNESVSILGLYLGALDGTKKKIGDKNYDVLIFNEEDDCWFKKGIILLESLILAPHGSTKRYEIKDQAVIPVLAINEQVPTFVLDVQKGAMKFVEDYSKSVLSKMMSLSAKNISAAFENMTCRPKKEELVAIGELEYDNFYCNKMAAPKRLLYYLMHIRELKEDLKYSPWRIGFLYRLFKLRLPYAKMYAFARRKQGKMT